MPRNQGGSDDLSNLKALCFRRNAGKRDGCLPTQEGFTDFRSLQTSYAHRQDSCVFCALEAEVGASGERTGAVQRRCLSGNAWAQPGDPAAAWIRWVGIAPAGMERGGGAAEAAAGGAEQGGYWGRQGYE